MIRYPILLYIFIFLIFLWCALIVITPLLAANGHHTISNILYKFFAPTCHQNPSKSFHLYAYKFPVCWRCSAIYLGMLLSSVFYVFYTIYILRTAKINLISFRYLIIVGIIMLIEVILHFTPFYTSGLFGKMFTGLLLGGVFSFYLIPLYYEIFSNLLDKRKI